MKKYSYNSEWNARLSSIEGKSTIDLSEIIKMWANSKVLA